MNYLFLTNQGSNEHPELVVQPFDANTELNDYEVSHSSVQEPKRKTSPWDPLPRLARWRLARPTPPCPSVPSFEVSLTDPLTASFFTDPLGVARSDRERGRDPLLCE